MFTHDRTFGQFLNLQERGFAADSERGGLLKGLRAKRQAVQATADAMWQRFSAEREAGLFDGSFLEYLLEHADEIFALITKFIALFS